MPTSPVPPKSLFKESEKCAKILRQFTLGNRSNVIPADVFSKCKGVAFLSLVKVGFLGSVRGGSGLVINKLPNGEWSAPSAIGVASGGFGFQAGMEVTDCVLILIDDKAVQAFANGGNFALGANVSTALGPFGRQLEASSAVGKDESRRVVGSVLSYSRTRGLFVGCSLEGTVIVTRKKANKKYYGDGVLPKHILNGDVVTPPDASPLYEAFRDHAEHVREVLRKRRLKKARKAGVELLESDDEAELFTKDTEKKMAIEDDETDCGDDYDSDLESDLGIEKNGHAPES